MAHVPKRRMGSVLREAAAMLTQARYLHRDLRPSSRLGHGPHVVFFHGLYATAGVFRPLRSRLEADHAIGSSSMSYVPGVGIEELSTRLAALIAALEHPGSIYLVGHSLGGLVARHYARGADCDSRVQCTISLAAPFFGSTKHGLVPGQAGRDIAPDSALLPLLREHSPSNCRVPHLSIVAAEDRLINLPAYPDFGDHAQVRSAGHNGILFHEETMRLVSQRIASAEALRR